MRWTGALLLAVAAVTLAGCGGGKSGSTTAPATTTTAPTTVSTTTAVTTTAATSTATTTAASTVTISVQIKGGKPVGGIRRATAKQGEKVALVVHSSVADEVHVHGYDLHKDVEAGGTVRIQFVAKITGVFEAELESRKLQIAELTVR